MTRPAPVVDFPQPIRSDDAGLTVALDLIRATLGKVSSVVVVPLLLERAGYVVTGGLAPTTVAGTETALDVDDARLDSFRVVAFGHTSGGTAEVVVRDVTPGLPVLELARVVLPVGTPGRAVGSWALPTRRPSGARWLEAAIAGNGVATQTLVRVELHARTTRAA